MKKHGNAPLFTVVYNSKQRGELIQLLWAHGADPLKVSPYVHTPFGLGRRMANHSVKRIFADLP